MFINPVNLRYLSKWWVVYEPCTNGQQIQKAYELIFKQTIKLSLTKMFTIIIELQTG